MPLEPGSVLWKIQIRLECPERHGVYLAANHRESPCRWFGTLYASCGNAIFLEVKHKVLKKHGHLHRLGFGGWFLLLACGGCGSDQQADSIDLGAFEAISKVDEIRVIEVPFEVVAGDEIRFAFRTVGRLSVRVEQDRSRSWERLQLEAQSSSYRRKSWRGRSPFLNIPSERAGGGMVAYFLGLKNWGSQNAYGNLRVETELSPVQGVTVVFNQPDCDNGCRQPAGELRNEVLKVIQSARVTIDMAMYGLKDPAVMEALCNAAEADVALRVVTENDSEDRNSTSSYWRWFFSDEEGLAGCGAQVEAVRSGGIMHHKFLVIDRGADSELLVTGSTNLTPGGFDQNHNHMLFIRGVPDLVESFQAEFEQLLRHCASDRLDGRSCSECTPGCTEDRTQQGPWSLPGGDGELEVFFSPSDDALRLLRGKAGSAYLNEPDPDCYAEDANCVCRLSGSRWLCAYCALGEDGYGLMGQARERILMSMFSATDQCFALAWKRAAHQGVESLGVWDYVKSGSPYARDDYLCSHGVPTYITNWGGWSAQVRNHNKSVVVDDVVFDGSLNLSESGIRKNNENTLVFYSARMAQVFADYILSEVALLERSGVVPGSPEDCLCKDLVDNDADGQADGEDSDCDDGLY
jgi:phosphatidylserine/phosphatidylglycerophosphate/cardiolipin synthase-like enzyme